MKTQQQTRSSIHHYSIRVTALFALVALLLCCPARATVLYWFTAEGYPVGTNFNHNAIVAADVGTAQAQVSTGGETIYGGPDNGLQSSNAQPYALTIATAPNPVAGRPGSKAVRFEVRRRDYKFSGHRSEFSLPHVPSGGTYWYAWSVYVPTNEGADELWDELVGQAHADDTVAASPPWAISRTPYTGSTREWYGGGINSEMAWCLTQKGGAPSSTGQWLKIGGETVGVWADWVMQIKYARDNTGFLNLWRDGVPVVTLTNLPTDYTNSVAWPYYKFGIYKWPWKQGYYTGTFPTSVVYFDEVKIGDAAETYETMAPRRDSGGGGGGGGEGFLDADVGNATPAGSHTDDGITASVTAGGTDIWGTSDRFHYAYLPTSGDTTIIARVTDIQDTAGTYEKAGVMFRETTNSNSRYVFVLLTRSFGVRMHYRGSTGGSAAELGNYYGVTAPYWVKLVRSGNTFTGYRSADGSTWQLIKAVTVPMSSAGNVGLAVTAHNASNPTQSCISTFDNITMTSP